MRVVSARTDLFAAQFDLVVFDIAGTTVQDRGEVPRAFTQTLDEYGVSISADDLTHVRGASKREALSILLGPARADQTEIIYTRFVEKLAHSYGNGGAASIAGAKETFDYFRERDVAIALNTGFERSIVDLLLSELGWAASMFGAVVCGDEVARGRPAPDLILAAMARTGVENARRVVNVGDTVLDLRAGVSAGVGCNVGVLSGAHAKDRLAAEPHTFLINSVRELPALLSALS
jgi:phosphonatase-like hydrolase